jgi:cell division protein FtsW (lipid II flippase)
MHAICCVLVLWVSLVGFGVPADNVLMAKASGQHLFAVSSSARIASVDPNKAPSEFNHHIAGWALIGVGLLVLVTFLSPNLRPLRYFWPALFLFMGLFLAFWSDAEIWPRGNMSWAWLLHHDREAGQHKIYSLLLIAIGIVEYLRARGSLNRFWRAWAFCILAVVGAASLLVHDHTAGAGGTSPEAQSYLINPALGPDGTPRITHPLEATTSMVHPTTDMDHSGMPMDHSSMDHSSMLLGRDTALTDIASPGHHHQMTPSMLLVEREHFWFMIVGLGVALFKLICDAELWRRGFIPYIWPSGMVLLGILLVLYQE